MVFFLINKGSGIIHWTIIFRFICSFLRAFSKQFYDIKNSYPIRIIFEPIYLMNIFIFKWRSGGDHGIHCWWDVIRLKQLSSVFICHAQVFAGFSGHGHLIRNIIARLKKENIHLYPCPWGYNNYLDAYS